MSDKQIHDWQEKVRSTYGEQSRMYEYLFTTMDNFYYRYLETTTDRDLKTRNLAPNVWGARSTEGSMVDALKITNPVAKKGIIELAKSVPKAQNPLVKYELHAKVDELTSEHGVIHLAGIIDWGFPQFDNEEKRQVKTLVFEYSDLAEFRKEFALKLEEVCAIFL